MNGAPVLATMEYRQFDAKFRASLQLKDHASLASALRLRQEATEEVRDIPALYCVGKHNEMILEYNHIGHGIEARQSALESLKHEDEFRDISLVLVPMFRSNFYHESVDYMTCASTSYEEGLYYFTKLKDEFPTEVCRRRYEEFKAAQSKYGRWFSTHRAILGNFYSRASAQMDKGLYAGGLAVLDVILGNAQRAGYNLDYEEYVDLLDDMCCLASRLLMQKCERRPPARSAREEANELGCILKKPMVYLTDFYPECLPKDRNLFGNYYKAFALLPWIGEVPGWQELTKVLEGQALLDSDDWRESRTRILSKFESGSPPEFWGEDPFHREEGARKLGAVGVRGDARSVRDIGEGTQGTRARCIVAGAVIGAILSSFAFAPLVRFFVGGGNMRADVPPELRSSLVVAFVVWALIPGAGWGSLAGTFMPVDPRIGPLSFLAGALSGLCGVCCAWASQWGRVHQLHSGQIAVAVLMSVGTLLVIVPIVTMTVGLMAERLIRGK